MLRYFRRNDYPGLAKLAYTYATTHNTQHTTYLGPLLTSFLSLSLFLADFVQELYLKELKAYKIPAVKETDSEGQVQVFSMPKTPASPEEANLADSLKTYESMAVEIEGQDASAQSATGVAQLPDWLEAEEEEEPHH